MHRSFLVSVFNGIIMNLFLCGYYASIGYKSEQTMVIILLTPQVIIANHGCSESCRKNVNFEQPTL